MGVFKGLSAFPFTPADADGHVDAASFGRLVSRLLSAGVDSIGILGSTGSYPYLSRRERRRAVDAAMEVVGSSLPVMVGIGALRTDEAVKLAKDAKEAGAAAGLLSAIAYLPLSQDEMFNHFAAVEETGLAICIYDNPGVTNFRFSNDLLQRLSKLPGVVAIKNPPSAPHPIMDHLAQQRTLLPEGFSIGYSGDWCCAEAMLAGANAWYSVLGGILPRPCLQIVRAAQAGDLEEAHRINAILQPVWRLFREYSSFRVVHEVARQVLEMDLQPPLPILPVGEEARRDIASVLSGLPGDMLR